MPIYPISFSIPEEKIVHTIPEKHKKFAFIDPRDISTYIYDNEQSYYRDYRTSVFGHTMKKAGWDCLRHYEILANGCIPWFHKLDECPPQTMTHFPKSLVKEAMESSEPETYIPKLLDYTRKHLTCRAMAQYVLDTVGCPTPTRILYLGEYPGTDYLRCLTLIGMKQILGSRCVEHVHVPGIYEDCTFANRLYGKGFSYSRVLPVSSKPDSFVIGDIGTRAFDLVIYGSVHRGMPYWDVVNRFYSPDKILLFCGEDTCRHCIATAYGKKGYQSFIREISLPSVN